MKTNPPASKAKRRRRCPANTPPQVLRWRIRRTRYAKLKAKILELVKDWSPEKLKEFLATPQPRLEGRTPKQVIAARALKLMAIVVKLCHTV